MLLIVDNYDSFTYNLAQYLGELGAEVSVRRNDQVDLTEFERNPPSHIVISPGPCTPNEAGLSCEIIRRFGPTIPLLGVCLGHQCIGAVFGGIVERAPRVMHGKTSRIHHDGGGVFADLDNPFEATRYHSLIVRESSMPDCLIKAAWTEPAEPGGSLVMGLRHRSYPIHGVQFHPESILTQSGKHLLRNFISMK